LTLGYQPLVDSLCWSYDDLQMNEEDNVEPLHIKLQSVQDVPEQNELD